MWDEYGFQDYYDPEPSFTGQINVQNPAPWDGGYDYGGYDYGDYQDYSGPTSYGQGAVSRDGGDWDPIYAPPQAPQYSSTGQGFISPAQGFSSGYTGPTQYRAGSEDPSWAAHRSWASGPSIVPQAGGGGGARPLGGSPSGGQRSMAQQAPQQITMGKPEDDLYKRYKSLLMNPDFSGDPSYQFLYNQGLQALNRNLAAQRKTLSGKAMNDTFAYGAGMTSKYMQDLLPQYRGGAQHELERFMGPAGLLPGYARTNNAAVGQADNMTSRADAGGYGGPVDLGLDRSGFTASGGGGIGWGGVNYARSQGFDPRPNAPMYTQRPLNFADNYDSSYEYTDAADNIY